MKGEKKITNNKWIFSQNFDYIIYFFHMIWMIALLNTFTYYTILYFLFVAFCYHIRSICMQFILRVNAENIHNNHFFIGIQCIRKKKLPWGSKESVCVLGHTYKKPVLILQISQVCKEINGEKKTAFHLEYNRSLWFEND